MGGPAVSGRAVDYADVQGLVRFGYGSMTEATYALLRIRNAAAARAWLSSAPITSAVTMKPPPATALHVGFTAPGLEALGVPAAVLAGFSSEFRLGMTEASRARRLGDVGSNAPSGWIWGGTSAPHLLVMFIAERDGLETFVQRATGAVWHDAFDDPPHWLPTGNLGGLEPFGFADGISQPHLDWEGEHAPSAGVADYGNLVALGEFLLGYRNEYGKYTDRPLVEADSSTAALLDADDAPGKKDVARNGTYLVMRQLQQDVRRFWQFVHAQSGGNWVETERLAAAMVGRTRAGEPLVPIEDRAIPGTGPKADELARNQFTFDRDPAGVSCPFGAHIRRANPRNADYPGGETGLRRLVAALGLGPNQFGRDLISSVRFHRVLRRGREYGPGLSPSDALAPAPVDDPERGLHFVCLNANISRQFEFLQNAWMMNTKFSALTGESDPLLGNRSEIEGCPATADFTMPARDGVRQRVSNLPQFVTVRGGAYFFLPSLRALSYFARGSAVDRGGIHLAASRESRPPESR